MNMYTSSFNTSQKNFPAKREHISKGFVTHFGYLIDTCLLTSTIFTQKKIFLILLLIIRKQLLSCPIFVKYPFPKDANLSQSISSKHDWKLNTAFLIYSILVARNILIEWWYIDIWYQKKYYESKLYDISRLYLAYCFFFPYFFLSIKFYRLLLNQGYEIFPVTWNKSCSAFLSLLFKTEINT